MNEKVKFLFPYVITFIIGALLCGGFSGLWISYRTNHRIADIEKQNVTLRRANQEIRDINKQLEKTISRDATIKQQLGETIRRQQEDIERANNYLEQAGESNKLAGEYTYGAIAYLDEIIEKYRDK